MDSNNEKLNQIISSELKEMMKTAQIQVKMSQQSIVRQITDTYLPVFEMFKNNFEKHDINVRIERSTDKIAECITLYIEDKGDVEHVFDIQCFLDEINYIDQKPEKPITIMTDEGEGDCFDCDYNELTQGLLTELVLEYVKKSKIIKQVRII